MARTVRLAHAAMAAFSLPISSRTRNRSDARAPMKPGAQPIWKRSCAPMPSSATERKTSVPPRRRKRSSMTAVATHEPVTSEAISSPPRIPAAVMPFANRQELGIWRRIECIMAECKRLPKTETNKDQDFDYTPYDDIAEMIRPLLAQYGVAIAQEPIEFYREGTLTRVKYRYEVVNTDRPEDRITLHNYGEGADLSDKGFNKASPSPRNSFSAV